MIYEYFIHRWPRQKRASGGCQDSLVNIKHFFAWVNFLFDHFLKLWDEQRLYNELTWRCMEPWVCKYYQHNNETKSPTKARTYCITMLFLLRRVYAGRSSPAETLGSWVLIPFEAWMSVYVYSVFVCVLCVGSGLATSWSSVQGVLPVVYRIKKLKKAGKVQQKDCRVIDR
jgi:hypothetical protein